VSFKAYFSNHFPSFQEKIIERGEKIMEKANLYLESAADIKLYIDIPDGFPSNVLEAADNMLYRIGEYDLDWYWPNASGSDEYMAATEILVDSLNNWLSIYGLSMTPEAWATFNDNVEEAYRDDLAHVEE
jgi:hypothetical protein